MQSYKNVFKALNTAGVRYLVVGGVAMNLLGRQRFTGDIDILLAINPQNLKRMAGLMERMGYVQRIPVSIEELGDEKKALKLMKEKNLLAYTFINSKEPEFNIDVIVGESLNFSTYNKHRILMTVWGITVPVISIDDLIGMKRRANRAKDVEDVLMLLTLKGL